MPRSVQFCSAACRRLCRQARKDWIGPWPGPWPVSRSSLSTASAKAAASRAGASPLAMAVSRSVKVANAGSGMPGVPAAAASAGASGICGSCARRCMTLRRRGRQRAMGDLKLGKGHASQCLAHRHCRVETVTHQAPWTGWSRNNPPLTRMIPRRGAGGQVPNRRLSFVHYLWTNCATARSPRSNFPPALQDVGLS